MTRTRMRQGIVVVAAAVAAAGCDASPRGGAVADADSQLVSPTARTEPPHGPGRRDQPSAPDVTRLSFDPSTRTLRLYDLPEKSARWMLKLPAAPGGVPVDGAYQFPMDADLDPAGVAVYYTLPNRRPSPGVSLQEVMDTHGVRARR